MVLAGLEGVKLLLLYCELIDVRDAMEASAVRILSFDANFEG